VGTTGHSLPSVADRIAKAAVTVVAVWHRWPVRNGITEFFTPFKRALAFIVSRTVLRCTQIIRKFKVRAVILCVYGAPWY
jgi:hypothetical protein